MLHPSPRFAAFAALLILVAAAPAGAAEPSAFNIAPNGPELTVVTCDSSVSRHAGTNDRVFVDVHEGTSIKTFELDGPGEDRNPGFEDTYVLPGLPALKKIDALTLRKEGNDDWCVEAVELATNGSKINLWGYDAANADRSDTLTWGSYQPGAGYHWLDDQRRDAPSSFLRFSDRQIRVPDTGNFQAESLILTVHTCNQEHAQSDADIRIKWIHDGVYEELLWKDPGVQRNGYRSITLTDQSVLRNIDSLTLVTGSRNGWCIDHTSLQLSELRGSPTPGYVDASPRHLAVNRSKNWLDVKGEAKTDTFTPFRNVYMNRPLRGEATHTVFKGLPMLREGNLAATWDAWVSTYPDHQWPICSLGDGFDNASLEGMFITELTPTLRDKGAYWGKSGAVHITRVDETRMRLDVRFEYPLPGQNVKLRLVTNVDLGCTEQDEGGSTLTFEPVGKPKVTSDAPPAVLATGIFIDFISTAMARRGNFDFGRFFGPLSGSSSSVARCDGFTVSRSGGLDFGIAPAVLDFANYANLACK